MWKLSSEAQQAVNDLYGRMRRPSLLPATRTTVRLIEQLANRNEPAAIPAVASGLFSSTKAIHDASSVGVTSLLALVPSIELIRLNELLGGYYWGFVSERWNQLKPDDIKTFFSARKYISVGGLLSFHKNGYVRHAATKFLSEATSGEELPFLLIRQNDWVPSISEDAQAIVRKKLTPDYLCHFANETDLLFHLLKCKRRDLSNIVSSYMDLLVEPEHRSELQDAIGNCNKRTGRLFVRHLLDREGNHLAETVRSGLTSSDPIIRTNCLKRAIDCLGKDECKVVANKLLSDKFIPVRQEAYELNARLTSSAEDVWRQCMFDKSRALRETAIFYLRKSNCDVADLYRKKLTVSPNSLPALSGLVSCGDASDLEVFSRYLNSPFAGRRTEAVRGIGQVGSEPDVLELREMLFDKSARVVRATYNQLLPIVKSIDSDRLFNSIENCKSKVGADAILRLLVEKGRWASLSYLIRGSVNSDQNISAPSRTLIDYTFSQNRVFTQSSPQQRKQIQRAIDESQTSMNEELRRNLSSFMSSFGFRFSS